MSALADEMIGFEAKAAGCTDLAALAALSTQAAALAGMTAVACGMITGPRVSLNHPLHFATWPAAWVARYHQDNMMERDPLPRWAIVSGAPVRWSDVMRQLPPTDPGHAIATAAVEHGFRNGVVVPVRSWKGHLGLYSAGGPAAEVDARAFAFLTWIGTATLHRAEQLEQDDPAVAPRLSRREQECVVLLTQGLTEREIARQLGIGEVTARFHLDNARQKTGARSRTHLAGIAALWLGRPVSRSER